jgi:hypothetical protein
MERFPWPLRGKKEMISQPRVRVARLRRRARFTRGYNPSPRRGENGRCPLARWSAVNLANALSRFPFRLARNVESPSRIPGVRLCLSSHSRG